MCVLVDIIYLHITMSGYCAPERDVTVPLFYYSLRAMFSCDNIILRSPSFHPPTQNTSATQQPSYLRIKN